MVGLIIILVVCSLLQIVLAYKSNIIHVDTQSNKEENFLSKSECGWDNNHTEGEF